MRIVGGKHRGRPLAGPEGRDVRPTTDRTREALFNILTQGRIAERGANSPLSGAHVLDAFAGTGALGLEALSRGAAHVTFIESQAQALAVLRENIRTLQEQKATTALQADALHPPRPPQPCQLILLDPPYNQGLGPPAIRALDAAGWIGPDALISVELLKAEPFQVPNGFEVLDERRYGKAKLVFLQRECREISANTEDSDA
jgi:16S rRNA (guanine966-N2)-methyltransferase